MPNMCEKSISRKPGVKRITTISHPDKHGVKKVVSVDIENPDRVITGQTDGTKGEWNIPENMWNQEDLTRLVEDLEAEHD